MAKVLLIEDDTNLREIFEMRLQAEGYQTMVAADGEEGLVIAMKQKPDLIIADVMMPKLSGFEMLETLRATPEMNKIKVIMMTALGQAEDRTRGEKLGVVKYLVKSQVTLEDFVEVVRDVLKPDGSGNSTDTTAGITQATTTNQQQGDNSMQNDQNPAPSTPPTTPPADGDQGGGDMGGGMGAPATPPSPAAPAPGGDGGMGGEGTPPAAA